MAELYVKNNEALIRRITMRSQLISVNGQVKNENVKTEVKEEPIRVEDYLHRFETEAAGFVVDELPQDYIARFLSYLSAKDSGNGQKSEVDPFKVPKPRMDPNDPHLYVEEQK